MADLFWIRELKVCYRRKVSENHPQIYGFSLFTYYGKYLSKFLMIGLSLLCDDILIFLSILSFRIKNYFWIYYIFVWEHDSVFAFRMSVYLLLAMLLAKQYSIESLPCLQWYNVLFQIYIVVISWQYYQCYVTVLFLSGSLKYYFISFKFLMLYYHIFNNYLDNTYLVDFGAFHKSLYIFSIFNFSPQPLK